MNSYPAPVLVAAFAAAVPPAAAQERETIVVTATREARDALDIPASIDSVPGDVLREDQPRVNLSEALGIVPGIVVANRQNYAQDLQVSSRGFGARASFGTRGIRIIVDGIPATMPDGQGQTASIDLDSADRIEVLRGPYSAMYGNSSGGVIQVFTAEGEGTPKLDFAAAAGSFGMRREGLQFSGGLDDGFTYRADGAHFTTDGYREHSAATRDTGNAKFGLDLGSGRMTIVLNSLHQGDTQDPLGLTRAQFESDPRQADASALLFDTRKSISQNQAGAVYEMGLANDATLTASAYAGTRQLTQYLAMRGDTGLSAGGVVDLDRGYGGAGLRWSRPFTLLARRLWISAGLEYDRQDETRKGYVNNFGKEGALRRDEDDIVDDRDAYVQAEWKLSDRWSVSGGLRYSHVHFDSKDHFITSTNPDDSGTVTYVRTLPTAGVTYRACDRLSFYTNAGQGYETPTFAELAYRPEGTGLNFGLKPSRSTQVEGGVKATLPHDGSLQAAVFHIATSDEIVVGTNVNGRADYKNASRTSRTGLELSAHETFGAVDLRAAATVLDAHFRDSFTSGTPPHVVPSGSQLPGVPRETFYSQAIWRTGWLGMHLGAEVRYTSRIPVDDGNSGFAPSATVIGVRAGWDQAFGRLKLAEFIRADNLTDRHYAGSVIIADSNGRFFESAPGRNYVVGMTVSYTF